MAMLVDMRQAGLAARFDKPETFPEQWFDLDQRTQRLLVEASRVLRRRLPEQMIPLVAPDDTPAEADQRRRAMECFFRRVVESMAGLAEGLHSTADALVDAGELFSDLRFIAGMDHQTFILRLLHAVDYDSERLERLLVDARRVAGRMVGRLVDAVCSSIGVADRTNVLQRQLTRLMTPRPAMFLFAAVADINGHGPAARVCTSAGVGDMAVAMRVGLLSLQGHVMIAAFRALGVDVWRRYDDTAILASAGLQALEARLRQVRGVAQGYNVGIPVFLLVTSPWRIGSAEPEELVLRLGETADDDDDIHGRDMDIVDVWLSLRPSSVQIMEADCLVVYDESPTCLMKAVKLVSSGERQLAMLPDDAGEDDVALAALIQQAVHTLEREGRRLREAGVERPIYNAYGLRGRMPGSSVHMVSAWGSADACLHARGIGELKDWKRIRGVPLCRSGFVWPHDAWWAHLPGTLPIETSLWWRTHGDLGLRGKVNPFVLI